MSSDPREVLSRPAPPPDLVLRYGPEPEQVADIRLPVPPSSGQRPAPVLVVLHGGFWKAEYDRAHVAPMCADLAGRGYAVAALEYRRVGQPGGGWPGTLHDVAAGVDALPGMLADAMAATGGAVDSSRVGLVGHSAGGQLALWAAARHRLPPTSAWHRRSRPDVAGVVSLAGVCDLTQASALRLGSGAADALLGARAADVPDRVAQASPASMLPIDSDLALVHGVEDEAVPVQVSRDFAVLAGQAGDRVRLVELEGVEHFAVIDPLSGAWPEVVAAIGGVLRPG